MKVPLTGKESLYRRILELSFLTTADASFAIDATKDEIFVRTLRRLSGLDYEEFEDLLETVGRVADDWDDRLRGEFGQERDRQQQIRPARPHAPGASTRPTPAGTSRPAGASLPSTPPGHP